MNRNTHCKIISQRPYYRPGFGCCMTLPGASLWNYAQSVIVGGCGLLSKRPARYTGSSWPAYYKSAKGITLKAVDNKYYLDFSEFAIGCALHGYSPKIFRTRSFNKALSAPMTTLLSPYEPKLARQLNLFLGHERSWKFCRGGGEALALAIRYARAVSSSPQAIVCGYHGWHDWYISSALSQGDDFGKIFLSGLSTSGIPTKYSGITIPVSLEEPEQLIGAIKANKPGIIVFESARYELISKQIVSILNEFQSNGGILIADEVTSGLRFSSKLACFEVGLDPDFIVLGKGLGSGYAISALGVNPRYHNLCQDCFASSTHWTEQVGLAAACATIESFSQWDEVYKKLECIGSSIRSSVIRGLQISQIDYKINSLSTMISFQLVHPRYSSQEIKALLGHIMLSEGILFSTTIYPTLAHQRPAIQKYSRALERSMLKLSRLLEQDPHVVVELFRDLGHLENGFSRTQRL